MRVLTYGLIVIATLLPLCYGNNVSAAPCPFVMDAVETDGCIYIATETSGVWQLRSADVGWESVSQADFGSLSGDSYLCNHADLIEKKRQLMPMPLLKTYLKMYGLVVLIAVPA